jgi:hypothetical protein
VGARTGKQLKSAREQAASCEHAPAQVLQARDDLALRFVRQASVRGERSLDARRQR